MRFVSEVIGLGNEGGAARLTWHIIKEVTEAAMAIAPDDLIHLPGSGESEDPVGENPFPQKDARHRVWANATLRAEQELSRFKIELLERRVHSPLELADFMINRSIGKFRIWAKRGIQVVWGEANIASFDQWLRNYAEAWLQMVDQRCPRTVDREIVLCELRLRLMQEVEYWKAEARRYVARQTQEPSLGKQPQAESDGASPAQPGEPFQNDEPPTSDVGGGATERSRLLAEFKAKARNARIRVTDEMIAKAANPGKWNDRTMVTWWKRNDSRCKPPHDRKISAVLARDPATIWPRQ
jgi:hypothetical protein